MVFYMNKIDEKRLREKQVIAKMIRVYCHGKKHTPGTKELCSDCRELLDYASVRTDKCPFMETKTFCSKCKVSCYIPHRKEQIREVMKYSGPRMLLYCPLLTIRHLLLDIKGNTPKQSKTHLDQRTK